MKVNLNLDYIEYKTDFMSEVLVHPIDINEAYKLFIKANDQTYFPSFVYVYNTKYAFMYNIKISELADKIFGALTLT